MGEGVKSIAYHSTAIRPVASLTAEPTAAYLQSLQAEVANLVV